MLLQAISSPITLLDIIDKSLPLVGVFFGALLTPIFTRLIDKKNRKRTLKYELLKDINKFFNIRKQFVTHGNLGHFYTTRAELYTKLRDISIDPKLKQDYQNQIDIDNSKLLDYATKQETYFLMIVDLESSIIAHCNEILDLHSFETGIQSTRILKKLIKDSNEENAHMAISLKDVTVSDIESKREEIVIAVKKFNTGLQKQCDDAISKIELHL